MSHIRWHPLFSDITHHAPDDLHYHVMSHITWPCTPIDIPHLIASHFRWDHASDCMSDTWWRNNDGITPLTWSGTWWRLNAAGSSPRRKGRTYHPTAGATAPPSIPHLHTGCRTSQGCAVNHINYTRPEILSMLINHIFVYFSTNSGDFFFSSGAGTRTRVQGKKEIINSEINPNCVTYCFLSFCPVLERGWISDLATCLVNLAFV